MDQQQALEIIRSFCLKKNKTLAVAESVSSGELQRLFGSAEQAGLFFQGGLTVYNCRQKHRHLSISEDACGPCNGVSLEVAREMAEHACSFFDCDLTRSLTGYASPIPELDIYDLHAFGAIFLDGELKYCGRIESKGNGPDEIRTDYAVQLLVRCGEIIAKIKV